MIPWTEVLLRLGLAAIFGGMIGLERERKEWTAGLRTHMMVCLGAALMMLVSSYGFDELRNSRQIDFDPSRVAAQVVSGIGFIGAGAILFLRDGVIRGLTTAAGLWTVAGIGLAVGGGMYIAALLTTLIALVILWVLNPIETYFFNKFKHQNLKITTRDKNQSAAVIAKLLERKEVGILDLTVSSSENNYVIEIRIKGLPDRELPKLLNDLQREPGVKQVLWNN